MSDPQTSSSAAAALPARGTAESAPPPPQDEKKSTATGPCITCFACSRCEYPICDSGDLLLRKVRQGASEYAFQYNLDGLLDLDDKPVPCYSAAEVVHTSIVVSEALMKVPLPPAAQVVALESIVQSRKYWVQQRRSMNARLHEHGVAPLSSTTGTEASTPAATAARASSSGVPPESTADASSSTGPSVVRRYGDSTESRIDLVCVRDDVLGSGVQECTQDRSAAATTLVSTPDSSVETDGVSSPANHTAPTVVRDASFAHVPQDVLQAATAAAAKTQWSSPGNMSLREAYMEVNRTTLSSRAPWFQDYRCVGRVQCPDCHQALGFVFRASEAKAAAAAGTAGQTSGVASSVGAPSSTQGVKRPATMHDRDDNDEVAEGGSAELAGSRARGGSPDDGHGGTTTGDQPTGATAAVAVETHAETDGARLPHAKKTKNEKDAQAAAAATTRRGSQEALLLQQQQQQQEERRHNTSSETEEGTPLSAEAEGEMEAPPRFVGLELKRLVQRDWDLHAFQTRYSKSRELTTFRDLFPEAEELQSLYSRLLGLRTQTELYNSLLRRHKEQNDVQMALLSSNKDRMHTYDEKIKTMQQIIEAQRAQIEMQTRQIRNQEELVQSHRRQFVTQQRQMDVEQLLLTQQSKTIESQKEQLRLLKMHFQAVQPEVLEELDDLNPIPPTAAQLEADADAAAERTMARATATVTTAVRSALRGEDSAEEDWADAEEAEDAVDEEKLKDNHSGGASTAVERASSSPLWISGRDRTTPPAHLCGVPTSFPPSHVPKNGPAGEAPPTSSSPK